MELDLDGRASDEEIAQRRETARRLKEVGIDIYTIDDSVEYEDPYKLEAMCLILRGEEVSDSLMKKIKARNKKMERHGK